MALVKYCVIVFRPAYPISPPRPWITLGNVCPESECHLLEKVVLGLRDKNTPSNMKVATVIVDEDE